MDTLKVCYAYDVVNDISAEHAEAFWIKIENYCSYGDAEYTLISGKEAVRMLREAANEVQLEGGWSYPADLEEEGVFFAICG